MGVSTLIWEGMEDGEIDGNDNLIISTKESEVEKKYVAKVEGLIPTTKKNLVVIEGTNKEQSGYNPPLLNPHHALPLEAQVQLDQDPVRLSWLEYLLEFLSSQGAPLQCSPTVPGLGPSRHPLDLYLLYQEVGRQGGFYSCSKHSWKVVAERMDVPKAKSFLLRKIYNNILRAFEESDRQPGSTSTTGLNNFQPFLEETPGNSSEGGKCGGVKGRLGLKGQRVSVKERLGNKSRENF